MAFRNELRQSTESSVASHDDFVVDGLLSGDDMEEVELIAEPRHCDPVVSVGYSIPLVNSATGSASVALGMVERHSNIPLIVSVSGVSFFVSLGIGMKYTMNGIKGTVAYLRTRKTPSDWPDISTCKNTFALSLALTTALTKSGTSAILNHYYVMRLPFKFEFKDSINMPGWSAFSWTMSGFTFVGSLSSGGMQMYSKLRYMIGGVRSVYSNRVSHIISPPLGATVSLAYAISNFSGGIVSISHTFGVRSQGGLAGLCMLNFVNSLNTQFTNIPHNVSAVDKFFACFTAELGENPAYKNPYQVVSFTVAIGAGALMAYASFPVNSFLMKESLVLLGSNFTDVTDPVVEAIAGTSALSNIVWVGSALTPLLYSASQAIAGLFSGCGRRSVFRDDVTEVEPLLDNPESDAGMSEDGQPGYVAIEIQAGQGKSGEAHRFFKPKDEHASSEQASLKLRSSNNN